MKSSRIIIISLSILLMVTAAYSATTKAPAPHGKSVHGTVGKLDESAKTFTVTSAKKSWDLQWNDATKVSGGTLKDGEGVTVRYMVRAGKNVATSIMIAGPKKS
jgi:hypothetical protein